MLSVDPADGQATDFSTPVTYRVSAADGSTKDYLVTVTVAPSPHRVVSVHNSQATSWAGTGNPADYMNQSEIERMIERGVMELTGKSDSVEAWETLIPYEGGEGVAIKLNFNNTWDCVDGFSADPEMNAYADLVNALIVGLKSIGVPSDKIWLADPSRAINDSFREEIDDTGVYYYVKCSTAEIGGRPNVFHASYVADGSEYSTQGDRGDGVMVWINPAEVFVDAAHIINMPQLKGHGGSSITLGMKNHFGSVDFTEHATGSHYLHDYFYVSSSTYSSERNILADIIDNPVFRDKTRLVIGDGLMGHATLNYAAPELWETFGDSPPEILFFGVDQVATDSVMFDYLQRECRVINESPRNDDLLRYAASIGVGVFEHWNNDDDREYSVIDYVEIDLDTE